MVDDVVARVAVNPSGLVDAGIAVVHPAQACLQVKAVSPVRLADTRLTMYRYERVIGAFARASSIEMEATSRRRCRGPVLDALKDAAVGFCALVCEATARYRIKGDPLGDLGRIFGEALRESYRAKRLGAKS